MVLPEKFTVSADCRISVFVMSKQAPALLIARVNVHGDQWGICAWVFGVYVNLNTFRALSNPVRDDGSGVRDPT